jgi:predicted AAA+ superfamily ATPase
MEYKRLLDLESLLSRKSYFLFGPRATGKSFLIRKQLDKAQKFDLLDDDIYSRFLRRPRQLGEEISDADIIVIDEIQKLPQLLDEVHRLIETKKKKFLLTGSSARKLKHGGANLLAGRARSIFMFPLTSREISDFDLTKYVNIGGLPAIYTSDEPQEDLKSYVNTYLKEEIQQEALVRRFDHYAKFWMS